MSLALAATLILSAYFLVVPSVDMAVSALFHRPGLGFWISDEPLARAFRKSSTPTLALLLAVILIGIAKASWRRRALATATARRGWFLLAGLAMGPGLVVNGLLKAQWGRPRPVHVEGFGGVADYVPVWRISDACASNCSFVSGEASSAAWMVAAVLVMTPKRWRGVVATPITIYALVLSFNRIAFGGHFLSDVVLSWSLTALVLAVLYRLMVAAPGAARSRRTRWTTRPGLVPAT